MPRVEKGYLTNIPIALSKGLLQTRQLQEAMRRSLRPRFEVGLYDPDDVVPWSKIPSSVVESEAHHSLAREAASKSYVLLKNNGVLPIVDGTIAVVGSAADCQSCIINRYTGVPSRWTTMFDGIKSRASRNHQSVLDGGSGKGTKALKVAIQAISQSDVAVVFVMGPIAGESHDREVISLESDEQALVHAAIQTNTPIVLVVISGGPLAIDDTLLAANIWSGVGGMEAGSALADCLWGDVNPSGRLATTVYHASWINASNFLDMDLKKRGHRYLSKAQVFATISLQRETWQTCHSSNWISRLKSMFNTGLGVD